MNKNSILFMYPDFHCSFIYRDELKKHGWKADIFVPNDYPIKLLFSDKNILRSPSLGFKHFRFFRLIDHLLLVLWWFSRFWRYKYHLYYGPPPQMNFILDRLNILKFFFGSDFVFELWLSKLFKVKLIYLPTGCREEESKENYMNLDDGNICNNCGYFNRCNDKINNLNFSRIKRYFDSVIGPGSVESTQYSADYIPFKAIDLNLWCPDLKIPAKHKLPKTNKLRILHSAYLKNSGRDWRARNIKGTPFVVDAVERLISEGYQVEYLFIENKKSNEMRFYQVQADIVVEQLIYGSYGSTGVETMALGKPVICYLRPSFKDYFFKALPDCKEFPIIEADTKTIYEVLKKTVKDKSFREKKGKESRIFAEQHFDPKKNTIKLIKLLKSLDVCVE